MALRLFGLTPRLATRGVFPKLPTPFSWFHGQMKPCFMVSHVFPLASYSTNPSDKLVNKIDADILEVTESMAEEFPFLKEKNFSLEEKDHQVTLRKETSQHSIVVKFELPSDENPRYTREENQEEPGTEVEEDTTPEPALEFVVELVPKSNPENKIFFDCFVGAQGDEFFLNRLKYSTDQRRSLAFTDLSDQLQEELYHFLDSFEVNDSLTQFISDYCLKYECLTDVETLERLKKIVS